MVVRLGAVTGVCHARLINERFGRFWGWFSVGDLLVLNFLTIVTEFISVALALAHFGVSKYIAVPVAAAALIMITISGSFRLPQEGKVRIKTSGAHGQSGGEHVAGRGGAREAAHGARG
jgi:Mn2+/Fe2+ NRAMP family transporter